MTEIKTFDLLKSPLEGTNLIEASAGTGKTYTIAGLVLRLILERNLCINEILAVTFTEAATEELRHRIRQTLKIAEDALKRGHSEDEFLAAFVQKFRKPEEKARQLNDAIRDFDEAGIFTIHGFCRKVLQAHAFETASLFNTELIPDETVFKQEIADDFWRRHFLTASPLFVNYALTVKKVTSESIARLLGAPWAAVETNIIPRLDLIDFSQMEKEYFAAATELCRVWPAAREDVGAILTNNSHLSKRFFSVRKILEWQDAMDRFVGAGCNAPVYFETLDMYARSTIEKNTKKNGSPPAHPIFDCAEKVKQMKDALCQAYDQHLLGIKWNALQYLQRELRKRKRERNVQSFDDLLITMRNIIESQWGLDLIHQMRKVYRAALIDEFQDTDPTQYAIFDCVFRQGDNILFVIGDPKQSIYGFRGADIFTYLKATRQVDFRYTLGRNWRSEPDLISATNALFSRSAAPFVYEEIPFRPSKPAERKLPDQLTINGKSEVPFRCWFVDQAVVRGDSLPGEKRYLNKGEARVVIGHAVATEIAILLQQGQEGRALLGRDPVRASDIAVLVSTNQEAREIHEILISYAIPGVLYVTDNIFDCSEAREMDRVLRAVANPHSERLVSAALATDMIGLTGEALETIKGSDHEWERRVRKFSYYHEVWRSRGFMSMLRRLMVEEQVRSRLLSFPDGERRLTNVLHLGEVLHYATLDWELTMYGLIQWLSNQRNPDSPRLDEHQLRLESEADAVKVVTIHRSKGLEYPIVFCPFFWANSRVKAGSVPVIFHESTSEQSRCVDLGSSKQNEHRRIAEKENLAEKMRQLYVAVTRARNRCYTVWGHFNQADTSAMAYALHFPAKSAGDYDVLERLATIYKQLDDNDVKAALNRLVRSARSAIAVESVPAAITKPLDYRQQQTKKLVPRDFNGRIDRTWKISSFSSLSAYLGHEDEGRYRVLSDVPDYDDEVRWEGELAEEPTGIFSFPQGAQPGLVIHELFEELDFAETDPEVIKSLAGEKLVRYGFDRSWDETLYTMTRKVLSVPIIADATPLASIPRTSRIPELEFYYPVKRISPETVKYLFMTYGGIDVPETFPTQIERLAFQSTGGFMKGFIDLVFRHEEAFYLIDWKSNFLGNSVKWYAKELLKDTMEEHFYMLQYHIYSLALHEYLKFRLPNYQYRRHFGGVFYVFVRGVDPERGRDFGIYHAKPAEELIEAMSREFIG